MNTRSLKLFTGGMIAAGLALLLATPLILGTRPPKGAPVAEAKGYLTRGLVVSGGLLVTVVGAGIGAFFLVRRARDEYREASMENMRSLLEQTREDQLKKANRESTEE